MAEAQSPTTVSKPSSAQSAVKSKAGRTDKQSIEAIQTTIYNGVTMDLQAFFQSYGKGSVRISQLASSAIGDLLISMCNNIIKKSVSLLRLANKKTISGEAIRVAAQNTLPSISIDAQKGWETMLSDGVWGILDGWEGLKKARKPDSESEASGGKIYINEILRSHGIGISATAMKRLIKANLPCGWRMMNDLPAVALAIICHQTILLVCNNIKNHDSEYKTRNAKEEGLMIAPKHVFKAIQSHLVLRHILGGNINMVNAPQGLLVASSRKHRAHRGRSQSPAGRGTKRAREESASPRFGPRLPMKQRSPEMRAARRAEAEAMRSESEESPSPMPAKKRRVVSKKLKVASAQRKTAALIRGHREAASRRADRASRLREAEAEAAAAAKRSPRLRKGAAKYRAKQRIAAAKKAAAAAKKAAAAAKAQK